MHDAELKELMSKKEIKIDTVVGLLMMQVDIIHSSLQEKISESSRYIRFAKSWSFIMTWFS
jgi:hypothetical protein